LAHACLWGGSRLARAAVVPYRHADLGHVEVLLSELRKRYDRVLIATDGVFSMDGDIAPLHALAALAQHHDAWLLSDDAHGLGVVGGGRGSGFVQGRKADVPLQMGTLSKALGAYGGYICASAAVVDLVRNGARTLIYSPGLPPAAVAAAIAALDLIDQEPEYAALPLAKAKAFARVAQLPEPESPIVPVLLGEAEAALAASQLLEENGFLVTAIRPPTVPQGTSRLRFTFTAQHPDEAINRLAELVRNRVLVRSDALAIPAQ
jgi:8-amino-7-oxononanoate synthase